MLPTLTPLERQFIEKLDKELDKVETFYQARESEAKIRLVGPLNIEVFSPSYDETCRASALKDQLRELQDHRRIFHVSFKNHSKHITTDLIHCVGSQSRGIDMAVETSTPHDSRSPDGPCWTCSYSWREVRPSCRPRLR